MRSRRGRAESAEEAALGLVQEHAAELLRFARRFSHCADDAHDAYQRTIEILVRRLRSDPPQQPLPWVRTVLRNEALAVRRERERLLGRDEVDLDRYEGRPLDDPAERIVGHERLQQTAEALRRLKPQEVTALVLRAEGLSYREICTRMDWTYTKCNRAVSEGRAALLERLGAIESGAECARWLPLLSALADGEATAADLSELRPHLRACAGCRATLRDFRAAPAQVAALVPATLLPVAASQGGSLLDQAGVALHALAERATLLSARVQLAFEGAPAAKVAAVAASTAALAGGGAVLEHAPRAKPAAAHAARASAPAGGSGRLVTISLPLPPASGAARLRRPQRGSPAEFGAERAAPPEFAHGAAAAAEFAAAHAPTTTAVAAAVTPSSAPPPPSAPSPPSEFSGP